MKDKRFKPELCAWRRRKVWQRPNIEWYVRAWENNDATTSEAGYLLPRCDLIGSLQSCDFLVIVKSKQKGINLVCQMSPDQWNMSSIRFLVYCGIYILQIYCQRCTFMNVNKIGSAPECQWRKDWPHRPPTAPPGSLRSCRPSHLPAPAPSLATKEQKYTCHLFDSVIKSTQISNPVAASYSSYMSMLGRSVEPRIVGR